MKTIEAILIKFALVFTLLFVSLGIATGIELNTIFWISLAVCLVGLVLDFTILPKTSNKKATTGDLFLGTIVVTLGLFLMEKTSLTELWPAIVMTGVLLAISEWFFHIYLIKRTWEYKETSHTLKDVPRRH